MAQWRFIGAILRRGTDKNQPIQINQPIAIKSKSRLSDQLINISIFQRFSTRPNRQIKSPLKSPPIVIGTPPAIQDSDSRLGNFPDNLRHSGFLQVNFVFKKTILIDEDDIAPFAVWRKFPWLSIAKPITLPPNASRPNCSRQG
jgi:hypothetical protein